MAVEKSKVVDRYKALFGSVGLSATRLDAMAAKLAGKIADDADDDAIDAELNDLNEVYPFTEIKKNDDRATNDKNNPNKKTAAVVAKEDDPNEPAWFKAYREEQNAKIAALESQSIGKSRKEVASTRLAKFPKEMTTDLLSDIDSMSFADDEAFTSFLERKETTFKAIVEKGKLEMFDGNDKPASAEGVAVAKGKVKQIDADMAKSIAAS